MIWESDFKGILLVEGIADLCFGRGDKVFRINKYMSHDKNKYEILGMRTLFQGDMINKNETYYEILGVLQVIFLILN